MSKNEKIMEFVSGYDTYAASSELGDISAADAPATTWYCVAATVTMLSAATYEATC